MYCSKCGEADQNANSYCRKCGNFLSSQMIIALVLFMNILVFSLCLFSFLQLFSIYMTGEEKSFPNTLNNTWSTFGGLAFVQLITISYLVWLFIKMNRVSSNVHITSEDKQTELTSPETKDFLPPADFQSVIPSVVEETTKNLEKVRRK
jgi:hypothetical protein